MITEQEEDEQTTFVVGDRPEPASVWRGTRTKNKTLMTIPSDQLIRKFDIKHSTKEEEEPVADFDEAAMSVVDSEVTRNPRDWEQKMRQLSKELSTILHRLKNEKEEKGVIPKTEYKVAIQHLATVTEPSIRKTTEEAGEVLEDEEPASDLTPMNRLTFGALKINKKTTGVSKAYVTILREVGLE
jgi:hypothetical protein